MKIVPVIFLLIAALFEACHSPATKENESPFGTVVETPRQSNEQYPELALNNGAKWKADSTTVLNVGIMQNIIAAAKKESLENYLQTAAGLQDGLNKMVVECKMKGADHEALHHWLEPLMEKTKALKNANNIENAGTIFGEIENQINLFPQYFE